MRLSSASALVMVSTSRIIPSWSFRRLTKYIHTDVDCQTRFFLCALGADTHTRRTSVLVNELGKLEISDSDESHISLKD